MFTNLSNSVAPCNMKISKGATEKFLASILYHNSFLISEEL